MDANGSGDLDIGEFTSAMNSLGFSLDLVDAKHIFQLFDIDGDGRIKCWEFVRTLGQFEGQLGGDGSTVPDITDTVVTPPGHNTGKGGGGDPSPGSQKSKMAERSTAAGPQAEAGGGGCGAATGESRRRGMPSSRRLWR